MVKHLLTNFGIENFLKDWEKVKKINDQPLIKSDRTSSETLIAILLNIHFLYDIIIN